MMETIEQIVKRLRNEKLELRAGSYRQLAPPAAIRSEAEGESRVAAGYAVIYRSKTDIGGMWTEEIAEGAFAETLENEDQRALIDHDTGRLIGRRSSGTLRLKDEAKGVNVEIDLPDTTDGRDLAILLERGDMDGMSFAMRVQEETWDFEQEPPHRTITKARMFEVSAVTFPAYDDTELGLRSLEKARKKKNFDAVKLRHRIKQDLLERKL